MGEIRTGCESGSLSLNPITVFASTSTLAPPSWSALSG